MAQACGILNGVSFVSYMLAINAHGIPEDQKYIG